MNGKAERLQYWLVLAALLFLLFIAELMKDHSWIRLVFAGTMILVFGSVIRAIWKDSRPAKYLALSTGLIAIIGGAFGHALSGTLLSMKFSYLPGHSVDWMLAISMLSYALFVAIAIFSIGRHIFWHDKITGNVIIGGICIYMLIGLAFAFCYTTIALLIPGVFAVNGVLNTPINMTDYIYFSFSVLTTVGFGDITAENGMARVFAIIEAVTGCLFIAIMIAGLVGTYFAQRKLKV